MQYTFSRCWVEKLRIFVCTTPPKVNPESDCETVDRMIMEVSVRAAAAEIIAADFYAAPTDSLLPKKFGSSFRQQGSAPIVC